LTHLYSCFGYILTNIAKAAAKKKDEEKAVKAAAAKKKREEDVAKAAAAKKKEEAGEYPLLTDRY